MPALKLLTLTAATFLLAAGSASANDTTYLAVATQASTTDPSDWSPAGTPDTGDTILTTAQTQLVSIDADVNLGGLRRDNPDGNTPVIRLGAGVRASIGARDGIPLALRNPVIAGGGQDARLAFTMGARIDGNLRLVNGVSIDVVAADGVSGLLLAGGGVQFSGPAADPTIPAVRLHNGESVVSGPLTVGGTAGTIRPVFAVDETASLRFTENAAVTGPAVTGSAGHVVVEGGASVGRLEGPGTLDVEPGTTSRVVTLASAALQNARITFRQGDDGIFPLLDSGSAPDVTGARVRLVASPDADPVAAPQQQPLLAPSTSATGAVERFDVGRIDRGSAWAPSSTPSGGLVADRRVLARKEPVPGEDLPHLAALRTGGTTYVGDAVTCRPGDYNHATVDPQGLGTFFRDGVEVLANAGSYTLAAADVGHRITCTALVVDEYGNAIDDPAGGWAEAGYPEQLEPQPEPSTPGTPAQPGTPSAPSSPAAPTGRAPAAATAPVAPVAAPAVSRPARTSAVPVPAIAAAASTPAHCPTVADLQDVSSAWKLAQSTRSQATLTGSATPGIWRCSATGVENGTPIVVRSLPVLVANQQRAMLTSERAQTAKLRNPTLLSSGTQRISARLYARGGDAKLKTRATKFTQTVRKGHNTVRFTQTVGSTLPKGRYKLVVRAITKDGLSAPLVQEVTIG